MKSYLKIALVVALVLVIGVSIGLTKTKKTAWMGIVISTVDEDLADSFDLPVEYGALIQEVVRGSAANDAGLEEEDIVISFNGDKVFDADDLNEMIEDSDSGDEVELVVYRDDKKMTFDVTLESYSKEKSRRRTFGGNNFYFKAPKAPKAPKALRAPKALKSFKGNNKYNRIVTIGGNHFGSGAFMGVQLTNLSRQLGDFFGVPKGRGALITEIVEDSPAEKAGLLAGDVIIGLDDEKITDHDDLIEILHDYEAEDKVLVTVVRNKSEKKIDLTLGENEDFVDGNFFIPELDIDLSSLGNHWIFDDDDNHSYSYSYSYGDEEDYFDEAIEEYLEELEEYEDELDELDGQLNKKFKRKIEKYLDEIDEFTEEAHDSDDLTRGLKRDLKKLEKELAKFRKKLE